ncbi:MAG: gfo/Idh/MocA family oxidoreductase [Planctomycetaceae bacterium]|nr:MAG: gfo/Idh/MocA family oxidoreductase [Planctomycetaceae bacterium]
MNDKTVRVGLIGAGANTRSRHIPGFRAIGGVEIAGVANRTPASAQMVATEFSLPRVYPDWQAVLDDSHIDAVCIGTWPNMHCEITCAALAAGKHVLCEARMARNATEAHRMLVAAQSHPGKVAQIVPSPFGLVQDQYVKTLIDQGYLGELRELVVVGADDSFWDYTELLHWRQESELSGLNVLTLGILHETAARWTPPTTRVFAQSRIFEPQRPSRTGQGLVEVTVPDSLQVLTYLEGGARGIYHFSGVDLFGPGKQIHLYGSRGTIKYLAGEQEQLLCGRAGDSQLRVIELPTEKRGGWRVEAEFISAIRGYERISRTDFPTGVRYMEFTEAVARSAALNQPVDLPLKGLG